MRYVFGLFLFFLATLPVVGQTQTRNYSVSIEGAGTGSYAQVIKENPRTGVVEVSCSSTVRIKKFVYHYSYDINVRELWRNGVCSQVSCCRDDNGKVLEYKSANHVWTSSYHELPAGDWSKLSVLDLDTNTVQQCKLTRVGKDQHGEHYRLAGGLVADLWYDAQGRLCRRVMMRKDRQTTLTLINVSQSE